MTSPIQPPVDPGSPPVAAPAPGASALDDEIRQLAAALAPANPEALSGRKAVVDAVVMGDASTPPTITVNLGGIIIPGIRMAASYSPQVGDTVLLIKQRNEYFAAFKIQDTGTAVASSTDGGFIKATLDSGHAHNGSSGGDVMYRRVMDNGAWKVQWQGTVDLGASDTIISTNPVPADYRPKVTRQMVCARDATNTTVCKVHFNTDGTVHVITPTASPSVSISSTDHSHGGSTGSSDPPGDGVANWHTHSIPNTSHTHGASSSIARPSYVALNVEYFL